MGQQKRDAYPKVGKSRQKQSQPHAAQLQPQGQETPKSTHGGAEEHQIKERGVQVIKGRRRLPENERQKKAAARRPGYPATRGRKSLILLVRSASHPFESYPLPFRKSRINGELSPALALGILCLRRRTPTPAVKSEIAENPSSSTAPSPSPTSPTSEPNEKATEEEIAGEGPLPPQPAIPQHGERYLQTCRESQKGRNTSTLLEGTCARRGELPSSSPQLVQHTDGQCQAHFSSR